MTDNGFKFCEECEFAEVNINQEPCSLCNVIFTGKNDKPMFKKKSKTNADRIRQMTDEELAEFLGARSDCFLCQAYHKCHKEGMSCESALTEWLKSPADKDGEA